MRRGLAFTITTGSALDVLFTTGTIVSIVVGAILMVVLVVVLILLLLLLALLLLVVVVFLGVKVFSCASSNCGSGGDSKEDHSTHSNVPSS